MRNHSLRHFWGRSMTSTSQETETGLIGSTGVRFVRGLGVAALFAGLAACSSAPDWAKPALIYGEDASEAAAAEPRTEKDFPELADVPNEARPYSSESERAAITEGLANDRARARYTDEVLRGGTEPPAPAPVTSRPAPVTSPVAPTSAAPSTPAAPQAAVIPAPSRNARPLPSAEGAGEAEIVATRAAQTEPVEAAALPEPAPVAAPVQAKVEEKAAELAPTPAPTPTPAAAASAAQAQAVTPQAAQRAAVPAVPGARSSYTARSTYSSMAQTAQPAAPQVAPAVQAAVPTDTPSLTATRSNRAGGTMTQHSRDTFEPSRAPAIAAEALEAAGGVVSSRYGQSALSGSADPVDPVEVNLDALGAAPAPRPEASLETLTLRRIVSNRDGLVHDDNRVVVANVESLAQPRGQSGRSGQGGPGDIPPYVVNFANGSTSLNVADRHMIAEAADIALDTGGVVRVVGHASGISSDDARARLANFGVSMDRATAVANELIRQGVAADRVIVEAKGANAPAYYETAPQGEAGNRRTEIFIE